MRTKSRPSLLILPAATLLFAMAIALHARKQETETKLAKAPPGPGGASALTLAPDLSFTDDSSSNFPIRGADLADGRVATDRPTVIFFGTSHCWNTNREAERFVRLYRDRKDAARFLVIDLNQPSTDQRALIGRFYAGSIPTLAFIAPDGRVIYNRAGETSGERGEISRLLELLAKAGER